MSGYNIGGGAGTTNEDGEQIPVVSADNPKHNVGVPVEISGPLFFEFVELIREMRDLLKIANQYQADAADGRLEIGDVENGHH